MQERVNFEPVIETSFGGTRAEIRIMYIWMEDLLPVCLRPHGTGGYDERGPQ